MTQKCSCCKRDITLPVSYLYKGEHLVIGEANTLFECTVDFRTFVCPTCSEEIIRAITEEVLLISRK